VRVVCDLAEPDFRKRRLLCSSPPFSLVPMPSHGRGWADLSPFFCRDHSPLLKVSVENLTAPRSSVKTAALPFFSRSMILLNTDWHNPPRDFVFPHGVLDFPMNEARRKGAPSLCWPPRRTFHPLIPRHGSSSPPCPTPPPFLPFFFTGLHPCCCWTSASWARLSFPHPASPELFSPPYQIGEIIPF